MLNKSLLDLIFIQLCSGLALPTSWFMLMELWISSFGCEAYAIDGSYIKLTLWSNFTQISQLMKLKDLRGWGGLTNATFGEYNTFDWNLNVIFLSEFHFYQLDFNCFWLLISWNWMFFRRSSPRDNGHNKGRESVAVDQMWKCFVGHNNSIRAM